MEVQYAPAEAVGRDPKGGYYTFNVNVVSGASTRSSRARRVAFAAGCLAIATACLVLVAVPTHDSSMSSSESWAARSIVGDTQTLAAWKQTRVQFLSMLPDQFPESMALAMNFTNDPCSNFFEFSCGKWISETPIPKTQSSVTKSWDKADAEAYAALHKLLQEEYPKDSHFRPVSDWFASCMDTTRVEELGATPLHPYLAKIDGIHDKASLTDTLISLELWDIPTMFSLSVSTDNLEPLKHDLFIDSGGTILPDTTFYDEDSEEGKVWLKALHGYLANITQLAGYSKEEAHASAKRTLEIETKFAKFMDDEPVLELKDSYTHTNLTHMAATAPHVPWRKYFSGLSQGCKDAGIACFEGLVSEKENNVVLGAPYFFSKLSEMIHNNTAEYWRPYLRTHLIYNLSPLLSSGFINATVRLDASLDGIQEAPPRWKKCVGAVKNALPGLTDQLYVKNYLSPKAKADAVTMMTQLRDAFIANLDTVEWMDPKTKLAAVDKANSIRLQHLVVKYNVLTKLLAVDKANSIDFNIGEPKFDPFVNSYKVTAASYFNNSMLAYHTHNLHSYAKLDKPVDRKAWSMRASEVNAYYDNGKTALYVPAAILQPPFFSANYSARRNFGGIGCIMGHEFSHGFDDTGRKFDSQSRLRDWWDKPAVKRFKKRTGCISTLYDQFTIADTTVSGNDTLGENIADMGGLKIALRAYSNLHEQQTGRKPTPQDDREFFVSSAQNWCDKSRKKALEESVDTDEHSPNVFRVNGPVSQDANFARAFGCPAGSPMNPVSKCVLW
ncbi:hypothetical protein T484DRAFT_1908150 [Baffinella frigidus]|nr:hypothetical protein T484DRAFT_1908150 [Cryptophyta sp. CCMP2293]